MKKKGKQMDALLHHLLRSSAARFPGKEAIVHRNRRMTWAGRGVPSHRSPVV